MNAKRFFLYVMSLFYVVAGINHFVSPATYVLIIPRWLPWPLFLVDISGVAEISLGVLLIPPATRWISGWLIMAMLVVFFFLIHIPMSVDYWQKNNPLLWVTLIRLPLQFVLIWWAWKYTKPLAIGR